MCNHLFSADEVDDRAKWNTRATSAGVFTVNVKLPEPPSKTVDPLRSALKRRSH